VREGEAGQVLARHGNGRMAGLNCRKFRQDHRRFFHPIKPKGIFND
jgi:hypothetical protein